MADTARSWEAQPARGTSQNTDEGQGNRAQNHPWPPLPGITALSNISGPRKAELISWSLEDSLPGRAVPDPPLRDPEFSFTCVCAGRGGRLEEQRSALCSVCHRAPAPGGRSSTTATWSFSEGQDAMRKNLKYNLIVQWDFLERIVSYSSLFIAQSFEYP